MPGSNLVNSVRAMTCEAPGRLRMIEQLVTRGADEVLVSIKRVGVCGTDLHIFAGNQPYLSYPRVMGHELAGTVVEAPAGSTLAAGDVVFIVPYLSCGECRPCRTGRTNCSTRLQVLGVHRDGGMAERLAVPDRFVHKAPGITLDQAAMVEFLAIGAHAVRRGGPAPGDRVLVVGAGPIGIATALFAGLRGAAVTVLDPRADRLAFAATHLPVAHTVAPGDAVEAELKALTDGEGFDVVFDATGNPKAMERGFGFVGHGGSYVLVSIVSGDISFSDPEFHKREATLLASRNATAEDFELVLDCLRAGKVPTDALATHRLAFRDAPDRFADLLRPEMGVIKALIEIP